MILLVDRNTRNNSRGASFLLIKNIHQYLVWLYDIILRKSRIVVQQKRGVDQKRNLENSSLKKCKDLQCSCLNDTAIKRTADVHTQCHIFRFLLIPQETESYFGPLKQLLHFIPSGILHKFLKHSFSFIFNDRFDSNVPHVHFDVFVFVHFSIL